MRKDVLAHIALFGVAGIYAGNYIIAKNVMDGEYLQPRAFIMFRAIAATVLFWSISPWFSERVERKDLPYLALCGLFGVALNQMFFFTGLKLTTPIHASLIMITSPILVLVAAYFILGERIGIRKIIGILVGLGGAAYLIVYNKSEGPAGSNIWLGDTFIFLNASAFGIFLVLVKKMMRKYQPLTVIMWVFTFGTLFVLPFGLFEVSSSRFHAFDTTIWLSFIYVLLFTTFLAYLFNAFALKFLSAAIVGAYIYLQPVLTTLLSIWTGKDRLTMPVIITAVLICTGIFLTSYNRKKGRIGA